MYKYGWTGRDRAAGIETHENKKVKNEMQIAHCVCLVLRRLEKAEGR